MIWLMYAFKYNINPCIWMYTLELIVKFPYWICEFHSNAIKLTYILNRNVKGKRSKQARNGDSGIWNSLRVNHWLKNCWSI